MPKPNAITQSAIDSLPQAIATILVPFVTTNPILAAPLLAIVGIYGWSVVYRQERFNQLIQSIVDNPTIFTKDIISSPEFQDGLVVFIDSYFKLRNDVKLLHARNIFYDFAASDEKPFYSLERYNDTLLKISDSGIRFLGFVENEAPTIKEKYLVDKMKQNNNDKSNISKENFRKVYINNEPLSTFVDLWIESRVENDSKNLPNYSTTPLDVERNVRDKIKENIGLTLGELEQLGLLKYSSYTTKGWDNSLVSGYDITHYGRMFISVIKPENTNLMI